MSDETELGPHQFVEAFKDSGGIIHTVATKLGCTRWEVLDAVARWPVVAAAILEEREKVKDLTEERLIAQVLQGNMDAIKMYAQTHMQDRGYGATKRGAGNADPGPTVQIAVLQVIQALTPQEVKRIVSLSPDQQIGEIIRLLPAPAAPSDA